MYEKSLMLKKIRLVSTQVRIGGSKKKAKPKQKLLRNSFPATMIRRHCYTLQLIVNEVVFMLIMSDFMSVIRCKLLVVNRVLEYSRTKLLGWSKVIYPKYSKHWLSTVAHTIDCVCSKILNHGLNHGL